MLKEHQVSAVELLKSIGFQQISSRELKGEEFFLVFIGDFRVVFSSGRYTSCVGYDELDLWLLSQGYNLTKKTTKPKDR